MALCKWQGGACERETLDPSGLCSKHREPDVKREVKPRLVRLADFMAEGLEKEAARIPQGHPNAEDCRRLAKIFRESRRTDMIRVWEETPQK